MELTSMVYITLYALSAWETCKLVCIDVELLLGLMAYAALYAYLYSLNHHEVSSLRR
jgi:hypothetical protein